ncbi:unnamed protein product [Protopolystoma xenopodis]|uniref:Uncharacterized protein n=1 Tax=Protopolystoma xenopodis TaxID=117903 RepID=A0A3S5CV00_9PLAT|nr:unnamed protein product [Protopolystoma xenopodis]
MATRDFLSRFIVSFYLCMTLSCSLFVGSFLLRLSGRNVLPMNEVIREATNLCLDRPELSGPNFTLVCSNSSLGTLAVPPWSHFRHKVANLLPWKGFCAQGK